MSGGIALHHGGYDACLHYFSCMFERVLYNRKYVLGILYAQPVTVTASTIPKILIDAVQIAQAAVRDAQQGAQMIT